MHVASRSAVTKQVYGLAPSPSHVDALLAMASRADPDRPKAARGHVFLTKRVLMLNTAFDSLLGKLNTCADRLH